MGLLGNTENPPFFRVHPLIWYDHLLGGRQLKDLWNFHPEKFGEDEPIFDEHIFQRGWFNHQLVVVFVSFSNA